jgi:hypothetical protein
MRTYKIAAMVTHSGKHLETEVGAYDMLDALIIFKAWLNAKDLCMEALCELDVSEVVQ